MALLKASSTYTAIVLTAVLAKACLGRQLAQLQGKGRRKAGRTLV